MVNIEILVNSLLSKYQTKKEYEKRKIVFWYDHEHVVWNPKEEKPTDELREIIKRIENEGIKFKIIDDNYFSLKLLLEKEDTESDYLIYSPSKELE